MTRLFEETPLYRFFNVIVFLTYIFIILFALLAGFIGYGNRKIVSETVKCRDGTSYDIQGVGYNSYALCGICTNRSTDDKTFTNCSSQTMDYQSYDIEKTREAWSWSIIIYPLIVLIIGFGFVDAIKLIIIYIFSGRIALEKSILVKLIILFSSNEKINEEENTFEKKYPLLINIVGLDHIVNIARLLHDTEEGLKQAETALDNFFKNTNIDKSFFETDKELDLDIQILEEYYQLNYDFKKFQLANYRLSKHFKTLEEINTCLEKGENVESVKIKLAKLQENNSNEAVKLEVDLEFARVLEEEILKLKKQYGKKFKDKKISNDDIKKRVLEKHPEWRKETK